MLNCPMPKWPLKIGNAVDREEFYIEHFTIFTLDSMKFLAGSANFNIFDLQQIHEPSDKYTIYSILEKK